MTDTRSRITWVTGAALLAVAAMAAGWIPAPTPELQALVGSGPGSFGLLWACGLCVGKAGLVLSGGMSSLVAYLALSANLVPISACVGACFAAFTT